VEEEEDKETDAKGREGGYEEVEQANGGKVTWWKIYR
jgi:hypothetical protein